MRNKRMVWILFPVLICILLSCAMAESSSTLRTEVPAEHTVTCKGNGGVRVDGVRYTGTFEIRVPRLSDVTLTAEPGNGCQVKEITVSPKAGAKVSGKRVTLAGLYEDKQITVTFGKEKTADAEWLYDSLLGTGGGMGQLDIVYDNAWLPEDYRLLPIRQGNTLFIEALLSRGEKTAQRSLVLRADQIRRLAGEEEMPLLHFRSGEITATLDLNELTAGAMAWLLRESSRQGLDAIRPEDMPADDAELAQIELTWRELDHTRIELRITPDELVQDAWRMQVFLRADDAELDVTAYVPSLRADVAAPPVKKQVREERLLAGTLYWLPAEQEPDRCDCYTVTYPKNSEDAKVSRVLNRRIRPERLLMQEALPGEDGLYRLPTE